MSARRLQHWKASEESRYTICGDRLPKSSPSEDLSRCQRCVDAGLRRGWTFDYEYDPPLRFSMPDGTSFSIPRVTLIGVKDAFDRVAPTAPRPGGDDR